MATIIAKNDCSSKYDRCENTYFHFNGTILVLHYWAGNGGDEDNAYDEQRWTVYHDSIEGIKDLYIRWSKYESGYVEVHSMNYPECIDVKELADVIKEEMGVEMPTTRGVFPPK